MKAKIIIVNRVWEYSYWGRTKCVYDGQHHDFVIHPRSLEFNIRLLGEELQFFKYEYVDEILFMCSREQQ